MRAYHDVIPAHYITEEVEVILGTSSQLKYFYPYREKYEEFSNLLKIIEYLGSDLSLASSRTPTLCYSSLPGTAVVL